jgi:RNA:NAD 2'-phosphotransferase (TPT1/KptA family)
MKGEWSMLYHGTSSVNLKAIRKKGLLPCDKSGIKQENRKGNLNVVFLTDDFDLARLYAERACQKQGGNSVVLRVKHFPEIAFERKHQWVVSKVPAKQILFS